MFNSSFIADKTQSSSSQFLIDSYEQFLSEIREDVNEGETSECFNEAFLFPFSLSLSLTLFFLHQGIFYE